MADAGSRGGALHWKVHPLAQEHPLKSLLLLGIVVVVVVVVYLSFARFHYGAIALVVLLASLSRYFLPSYYTLDEAGIHRRHLGHRRAWRWAEFRRLEVGADGLFLSPFARPRRLDAFRGLFLPFHHNREQVLYYVRCHVDDRAD